VRLRAARESRKLMLEENLQGFDEGYSSGEDRLAALSVM
jgi:hypothetical protein